MTTATKTCPACLCEGDFDSYDETPNYCMDCVDRRSNTQSEELLRHNESIKASILDEMEAIRESRKRIAKLVGRQTLNTRELERRESARRDADQCLNDVYDYREPHPGPACSDLEK